MYLPDPTEDDDFDLMEWLELKQEMASDFLPLMYDLVQKLKATSSVDRYRKMAALEREIKKAAEMYDVDLSKDDTNQ